VSLLTACRRLVAQTPHLRLHADAAVRAVAEATPELLRLPAWDDPGFYDGPDERVVAWLLAYNAINYSYWPEPGVARWSTVVAGRRVGTDDEALGVMISLAQQQREGVALWHGPVLEGLTAEELGRWLAPAPGAGPLPLLEERLAALQELGRAYATWGGPLGLVDVATAPELVERLVAALPSWEDERGPTLRFRKRAQLVTGMIIGRFGGQGPGALHDREALTAYADYRLPQILRGLGVLELSAELAARIARHEELVVGCPEEVALRAAVVVGAEELRLALEPLWPHVTALEVDHMLWRTAVARDATLPPFHRTRTTDY